MKQILSFCFLLCICIFSKAQYVSIPDPGFRALLKQKIPNCFNENDLLDTTCSELVNVTVINISSSPIVYDITGIKYCKYLLALNATFSDISFLPELPLSLKSISFFNSKTGDTLRNLPSGITRLSFTGTGTRYIESLPDSLTNLSIGSNFSLNQLPQLPPFLKSIDFTASGITSLPDLPDSLKFLSLSMTQYLHCLPKLPTGLSYLNYDSYSITCVPNTIPAYPNLPVCNSTNNPNNCPTYNQCYWTGAVNNKWEDAGNWDCGHVPDSATDVIINSGDVVVSSNVTVISLKVGAEANLVITTGYNISLAH